jgi:hypothetical protein
MRREGFAPPSTHHYTDRHLARPCWGPIPPSRSSNHPPPKNATAKTTRSILTLSEGESTGRTLSERVKLCEMRRCSRLRPGWANDHAAHPPSAALSPLFPKLPAWVRFPPRQLASSALGLVAAEVHPIRVSIPRIRGVCRRRLCPTTGPANHLKRRQGTRFPPLCISLTPR